MSPTAAEQRNTYKGTPERAWVRARLTALDGSTGELDLLADTGSPYTIIISTPDMLQFELYPQADVPSSFGLLLGGSLRVHVSGVGMDITLVGYGNDQVVADVQASSPDFGGLIGLPLLRLMEYGGDANDFWVRAPATP